MAKATTKTAVKKTTAKTATRASAAKATKATPRKAAAKAASTKAPAKTARGAASKATRTKSVSGVLTLCHIAEEIVIEHELAKRQANELVTKIVEIITKRLRNGDKIRLSGLGILQVKKRAARMGRNPAIGEAIKIKAPKKIAFRPAKELKNSIQYELATLNLYNLSLEPS